MDANGGGNGADERGAAGGAPGMDAIARVLDTLLDTDSWDETRAVLEREQALLLTEQAEALLGDAAREAQQSGDADQRARAQQYLALHRLLLRESRLHGIAAGWAAFEQALQTLAGEGNDGDEEGDDFTRTLLQWLNSRNLREQRRYLEAHPELLDPHSDQVLEELIQQYAGQRETQDDLRDHLRLLRDIRARRRTQSQTRAIRDGYVNARDGLMLDVPAWIDEAERQLDELEQAGRPDQTAPARIALLREAVAHAQADISLAPQIVAELQVRLWDALDDSVDANERESQEEGISCLKAALETYTLARYPVQYASTQNNLGNTYGERIAGERRENLEASIAAYREALRVYTYEAFPVDYAMTQNNLGTTYADRIAGERRENLEASIAAFKEALRVRTYEALPRDHRDTQLNLAIAEADRGDWAAVAAAYTGALAAEDLLAALEGSVAGLDALVREGRSAAAHGGFALARLGRAGKAAVTIERGRARGLAAALAQNAADPALIGDATRRARYTQMRAALRARQAELNEAVGAEGAVYLTRNRAYNEAKAAFDTIVVEVRAAGDPPDFLQPALDEATLLRAASRGGTGHALVYLLATPWGGAAVAALASNPDRRTAARFAALDLPLLTDELVDGLVAHHLESEAREAFGGFAYAQEGSGFGWLLQDWPGETLAAKVAALRAAAARSGQDSALLRAAEGALRVPALAGLAGRPLEALVADEAGRALLGAFSATLAHAFLRLELTRCRPALADAALRPLAAWLGAQGATSLTLVPCGALAAFPLLAVELAPGQTLVETLPASVAPSARSLLGTAGERPAPGMRAGVYAAGDPRPTHQPLAWGEAEALALEALARRLKLPGAAHTKEDATRDRLIAGLTRAQVVDASCHGGFARADPLESSLFLAGGERLTLRDALSHAVELRGLRLLILSACQTAILDLRGARDEVRSLAAGMLQAGAAAVLAAQWAVDDRATYLLMVRFAQEWLPCMMAEPPAAALARAQHWLRHATNADLRAWRATTFPPETLARCAPAQPPATSGGDMRAQAAVAAAEALVRASAGASNGRLVAVRGAEAGRGLRYDVATADETLTGAAFAGADDARPYADPIFWAAFQMMGW